MQMKQASEMSADELRAEVAKIEAQRAKRRAYNKLHRKQMTPELKAKLTAYNAARRQHTKDVLARAAELPRDAEQAPVAAVVPAQPRRRR